MKQTAEHQRLEAYRQRQSNWKNWGPYLSERAWGTVREDYSGTGEAWDYFPHDHARSRAYRWNEDGLAGISDRNQYLCFALALWNGNDGILKERMFGLTGVEGNHGEDVKEYYYYLDSTPTHSYMKMLYKYPQGAFPYADLVGENQRRGFHDFEYELMDTGAFDNNRYFDVTVEYAKVGENDILARINVTNRADEAADITVLPTLWFRNTWSWGYEAGPMGDVPEKPTMRRIDDGKGHLALQADHPASGIYYLYAEAADNLLFTENETNAQRLFGLENATPYVKDGIHNYIIHDDANAVNPDNVGTKAAAQYTLTVPVGETVSVRVRLTNAAAPTATPFADFEATFEKRLTEADEFYAVVQRDGLTEDESRVQRQAFAGMLWTKQLYYYDMEQWLYGDPGTPAPYGRRYGRNHEWEHLHNFDIISMPDKWEYPWYAGWDLAFHCLPLALVDPDFAKRQMLLLTREWYQHPNGQLPAYEWAFGDVNPPVHAWATRRVYEIDAEMNGTPDRDFLEEVFHKLLLNFTWWVNRKDADGNNIFQGGFLGLDNISVFDRSKALPFDGHIDQSDGTAWMAFYCLEMLNMSIELAKESDVYEGLATKFFEHFLRIAHAMASLGGTGLWDNEDGFFYDVLHLHDDSVIPLKVRSLVGLMPMIAVETIGKATLDRMPAFARRVDWFLTNRPYLAGEMASFHTPGENQHQILSILSQDGLEKVLRYMLDASEFLSDYGIRSVSKFHEANPYTFYLEGGAAFSVSYQPAESESGLFGGNSNWRGPIWFPINFLLIESLEKFYRYYGDEVTVEMPTGSGNRVTLKAAADELSRRLIRLFLRDENGERPVYGGVRTLQDDPHWRDLILFNEYFHGDNGAGLGAAHQTGWTGLVAYLIQHVDNA